MTKEELQKELKDKVKPGVKPSQLKRSRSLNDLPANQSEEEEIFVDAPEENIAELKATISQLEDQILELRLSKIKEFGEYLTTKKALENELESNLNYGTQEIERLENKLRAVNKKRLELQDQLSQSQSKNARLELRLINEPSQDSAPSTTNWWDKCGTLILILGLTTLVIWLTNKPTRSD